MGLAAKTAPSFYRLMKKKKIYRAISLVSLVVMAAAILSIGYMFVLYQKSNREYEELARAARAAESAVLPDAQEEDAQAGGNAHIDWERTDYAVNPFDFEYLNSISEDIIGWLGVQGTEIDYPILYDTGKLNYYLNHNYRGTFTPFGSAFVLSDNARDFTDFNTVVYGHNVLDGSMFNQLHKFEDREFFDTNKVIMVYTPTRVLRYQVFAAYKTDNLDQVRNFDYETPEGRQAYIDQIYTHDVKAFFDTEIEVTPDDRIITLSTCIGNPAYRYLVQGVLVSDLEGIPVNALGGGAAETGAGD